SDDARLVDTSERRIREAGAADPRNEGRRREAGSLGQPCGGRRSGRICARGIASEPQAEQRARRHALDLPRVNVSTASASACERRVAPSPRCWLRAPAYDGARLVRARWAQTLVEGAPHRSHALSQPPTPPRTARMASA